MMRIALWAALCMIAVPAYAGLADDVGEAIFEPHTTKIKNELRQCATDDDCASVLSMCRWRPVSKASQPQVSAISNKVKLECKWPVPPETPPVVHCMNQLCDILPDGRYY